MRLCYGEGVVALPKAPSFKLEIVIGQRCKYLISECMQCSRCVCSECGFFTIDIRNGMRVRSTTLLEIFTFS